MKKSLGKKVISSVLLGTICTYTLPVIANTKDETVYSKVNQKGENYSTIVSEKISNDNNSDLLEDITNLLNIENTNGEETFERSGDKIIWKSNGNKIQYQGTADKELPVQMNIKYELDGNEISADEIAGKSGKVKVTIKYINNDVHDVKVNGRWTKMYTPFVAIAGTIIDNKNNENITVTSGKIVDNGNRTVVAGIAMPGMKESLNIKSNDIEIPDTIEIAMDAKDFEMGNIMTYVTPKILEEDDLKILDDVGKIYSKVNELQNASVQLVDGSKAIQDGATKLNTGISMLTGELTGVIKQYETVKMQTSNKEAVKQQIAVILKQEINKMLPSIQDGAKLEAQNAIKNHKTELENAVVDTSMKYTTKAINEKIAEIQKQGGILTEKQEQILVNAIAKDIEEVYKNAMNDPQINAYITELVKAIKTENAKMQAAIKENSKKAVSNEINNAKQAISKATPEILAKKYSKEIASIKKVGPKDETGKPTITDMQALQMIGVVSNSTLTEVESTINNKIDNISVNDTITSEIETKIDAMISEYVANISKQVADKFTGGNTEILNKYEEAMMKQIANSLKDQLLNDKVLQTYGSKAKEELNKIIDKVAEDTAGDLAKTYTETIANEIAENLIDKQLSGETANTIIDQELNKYEKIISKKLAEVDVKVGELELALPQLTEGSEALENGSKELSDGMNKFNEEAIKKLVGYVNSDVKDLTERVKALKTLAEEYNTFTMINNEDQGNVKFIIIADEIKRRS